MFLIFPFDLEKKPLWRRVEGGTTGRDNNEEYQVEAVVPLSACELDDTPFFQRKTYEDVRKQLFPGRRQIQV